MKYCIQLNGDYLFKLHGYQGGEVEWGFACAYSTHTNSVTTGSGILIQPLLGPVILIQSLLGPGILIQPLLGSGILIQSLLGPVTLVFWFLIS